MKVYFDACALNRLFDDQSQMRIRSESEAVQQLLSWVLMRRLEWKAGKALEVEILQNPDVRKRTEALDLLSYAGSLPVPGNGARQRAGELSQHGYGAFDALHLAHAEEMK